MINSIGNNDNNYLYVVVLFTLIMPEKRVKRLVLNNHVIFSISTYFTLVLRHIPLFSRYCFSPRFLSLLFFGNSYFIIHVLGLFILSSLLMCLMFSVQVSFWIMSLNLPFSLLIQILCKSCVVWAKFGLFQRGFFKEHLSERAIMLLMSQFESPRSNSEELAMATNSQGRFFFLTERHRKLDKFSCSLPVLMSTLFSSPLPVESEVYVHFLLLL